MIERKSHRKSTKIRGVHQQIIENHELIPRFKFRFVDVGDWREDCDMSLVVHVPIRQRTEEQREQALMSASLLLSEIIEQEFRVKVAPIVLRRFIIERWQQLAMLAHTIKRNEPAEGPDAPMEHPPVQLDPMELLSAMFPG